MSRPTTPLPSSQTSPPTSTPPAPQSSPFRSTTAPVKKHHHHHHITHRHHHQRDKSVPQSAVLPSSTSSTFDSLLSPLTKVTSRTEGAPDLSSLIRDEREARARKEARERGGDKSKEERARLDKEAVKLGWEVVERRRAERKRGQEYVSLKHGAYTPFFSDSEQFHPMYLREGKDADICSAPWQPPSPPCPRSPQRRPAVWTTHITPSSRTSPRCTTLFPRSPPFLPPPRPSSLPSQRSLLTSRRTSMPKSPNTEMIPIPNPPASTSSKNACKMAGTGSNP